MGFFIGGLKKTKLTTNNTNTFGSISGLPPRVGVRIQIINMPQYGLHCRSSDNCCCLPISRTWNMSLDQQRDWAIRSGNNQKNQTCAGGVANRRVLNRVC